MAHSGRRNAQNRRTQADSMLLVAWLALGLAQQATAAAAGSIDINAGRHEVARRSTKHLMERQYPSDAPACASLCIRVKIAEAADPGLAPSCDYRTSGYVDCLCQSDKFRAAYDTCLRENCVFPSALSAGRSLFQGFCSSSVDPNEAAAATSVASSAVASQAAAAGSSGTTSSGVSSTTSGSTTSGSSVSTTSGTTTGTTSGTRTTSNGQSSAATSNASQASSNTGSSSSLNSAELASARANATGVSAARATSSPIPAWTIAATATFALLGSLLVLA